MQQKSRELSICGNLGSPQIAWLKSLGFVPDKSILDCNPTAQTITFDDGSVRQVTERYTRVMGYHRPVSAFNNGKKSEHADRQSFREPAGEAS